MKVDQVLSGFNYIESKKVRMVTYEFIGEICEGRRRHVDTWENLKREMRTRFVPVSYTRGLYNKIQQMYYAFKSIEEYHKDMKVALSRANVLESSEATMARFLHGLNQDIQDMVEMSHYLIMDDLVH
ncbi:hypothetical protein CR513_30345, partial [Mucuna pruriens]